MGSLSEAVIYGFICRICSRADQNVLHIYSEKARRLELLKVLRDILKLDISIDDKLPKTICFDCVNIIARQARFVKMVNRRMASLKKKAELKLPPEPPKKKRRMPPGHAPFFL